MRRRQRGMSLVVAIFLIVMVALLSAFAVSWARPPASPRICICPAIGRGPPPGRAWNGAPIAPGSDQLPAFPIAFSRSTRARCVAFASPCPVRARQRFNTVFDITAFAQRGNFGANNYASHTLVGRY